MFRASRLARTSHVSKIASETIPYGSSPCRRRPRSGDRRAVFAPKTLSGAAPLGEALDVRVRASARRENRCFGQSPAPGGLAEWAQVAAAALRLCRAVVR